jgi:hypothetical protein
MYHHAWHIKHISKKGEEKATTKSSPKGCLHMEAGNVS